MRKINLLIVIASLFCFLGGGLTAAALASDKDAQQDLLQAILKRGELHVGTSMSYPPFEMTDPDGKFIGFDMDVSRHMAKELGVKIKFTNVDWAGIISGLMVGNYDVVLSGMTATLKRATRIQFADPYFSVGQALLINKKKLPGITTYKDLENRAGITIATSLGTTGEFLARNLFPKADIRTVTAVEAATDVVLGKSHAMLFDEPFVRRYLNTNADRVYSTGESLSAEPLAMGVRQGLETQTFLRWLDLYVYQLRNITLVNEELMKEFDLDKKFMGKSFYEALKYKWFNVWLKATEK